MAKFRKAKSSNDNKVAQNNLKFYLRSPFPSPAKIQAPFESREIRVSNISNPEGPDKLFRIEKSAVDVGRAKVVSRVSSGA